MERMKKLLKSPVTTVVLFVLAAGLLIGSGVGTAWAAPRIQSDYYRAQVELYDIGVTLMENGVPVSNRDYAEAANGDWVENTGVLLANMLPEGESLRIGKAYPEAISVKNSGNIDEYVRVTLYKYWLRGPEGVAYSEETASQFTKKELTLAPSLIDLNLINLDSHWLVDEYASTPERTVLYYNEVLPATYLDENGNAVEYDADAPERNSYPLSDTLTVSGDVAKKATVEQTYDPATGYTTITTTYDYDGVVFQLEAVVDAVQTHNAQQAIHSAWGRNVKIDEETGILKLVKED